MASSFEEAAAANREAADALAVRDRMKQTAATKNPQEDTFAAAARRAKAEGWSKTPGPHSTE